MIVNNKGFTLVELLVTVAVLGILASFAVVQFQEYRQKAYDISSLSDLKNLVTSAHAYRVDFPEGWIDCGYNYGGVASNCNTVLEKYGFRPTENVLTKMMYIKLDTHEDYGLAGAQHSKSPMYYCVSMDGLQSTKVPHKAEGQLGYDYHCNT